MVAFPNPIVNRLVIYGSDGLPDVTIGPNPAIIFYQGADPIISMGLFTPSFTPQIRINNAANTSYMELGLLPSLDNPPRIYFQKPGGSDALMLMSDLGGSLDTFLIQANTPDGTVSIRLRESATAGFPEIVVNEEIFSEDPNAATVTETWHAVSWQNGWSAFTGSNFPPDVSYRKMPDGTILFRGIGQAGTKTDNTVLFTLPGTYFPPYKNQFVANTDLARVTIRLQVFTDGTVRIFDMTAAPSPALISFDGIRYPRAMPE